MSALTQAERLEMILGSFFLNSLRDLANTSGVSPQALYDIQKDKYKISKANAKKILDAFPAINQKWLLTGEGDMLKPEFLEPPVTKEETKATETKEENEHMLKMLEDLTKTVQSQQDSIKDLVELQKELVRQQTILIQKK